MSPERARRVKNSPRICLSPAALGTPNRGPVDASWRGPRLRKLRSGRALPAQEGPAGGGRSHRSETPPPPGPAGGCGRLRSLWGPRPAPAGRRGAGRAAALSLRRHKAPRSVVSCGRKPGSSRCAAGACKPRADWAAGRGTALCVPAGITWGRARCPPSRPCWSVGRPDAAPRVSLETLSAYRRSQARMQ